MQLLAQYPINEAAINPYIGRPVAAVLANGEVVGGIIDRVHDGHLVMRPLDMPDAVVQSVKKSVKKNSKIKANMEKGKTVKTSALGFGGYPWGYGYGNWGWGAGWWWIWPLFFLAALVSFPFWW